MGQLLPAQLLREYLQVHFAWDETQAAVEVLVFGVLFTV